MRVSMFHSTSDLPVSTRYLDANRSMSHFNLRRREAIQRPATLWPESQ
jgi:hypothetical protein